MNALVVDGEIEYRPAHEVRPAGRSPEEGIDEAVRGDADVVRVAGCRGRVRGNGVDSGPNNIPG